MPGEINQRVEAKERGANVLRDIARLRARQAAVEAVKTSKATLPSPNQLDKDRSNGTTIRTPTDN